MGLIMNQVNYPEKMVWAHFKLDTDNKEDILPYIRSSNGSNELQEDLLSEHTAEEDLPTTPLIASSSSIFDFT
jgi:hypothetical protein